MIQKDESVLHLHLYIKTHSAQDAKLSSASAELQLSLSLTFLSKKAKCPIELKWRVVTKYYCSSGNSSLQSACNWT